MGKAATPEAAFLNAVLDNAGALVLVLDRDGRIHRFNRACEKLSGYAFAEVEGRFPWEILLPPTEADTIRRQAFETLVHDPATQGGHYTNYWISKSGQRFLTEWNNTVLLDADGRTEYVVAVGSDVTMRHHAETRQRVKDAALECALNGFAIAELDGSVSYVNPAFLRMWGLDRAERALGRHATDFWNDPPEAAAVMAVLREQGSWAGSMTALRADGSRFVAELSASLVRDAQGAPTHMLASIADITERRRIEDALRDSEAWLRHTQAIADVGSWELELAGNRLKWSDETYHIFGVEPAAFAATYQAFLQQVHPEDRTAVDEAYAKAVRERKPYDIVHRILRQDGAVRWVQERGETVYAETGKALRTIGAVQDITARIDMEAQTRQIRDRLQFIIDASPDWIFAKDLEHRFTLVNKAFAQALGLTPQQMIGRPDTEFWSKELCEGNPAKGIRGFHEDDRRAFAGELTHNPGDPATVADGSLRVFDTIKGPLRDSQGKIIGVFAYSRDITNRIEAETRYQSVVTAMSEGVVIHQADGQIAASNAAAERILGLTADQLRGRTSMDPRWNAVREDGSPFPGEAHPGVVALRTGQVLHDVVMGVDSPGQGRRWILINAHPLRLPGSDAPYGSVASFTDITGRKQAEDALRVNNQLISAVLDTTPVQIAYLDPDMNFVRVNRAYAAADNREPDYFIGKNHFALYPNAENEAIFRRVRETGIPHTTTAKPFEYEHNPERGLTHWDWTLTPVRDANDRITGLVLSLLNVTDRIEALKAAQRNERKLKQLNESLEAHVQERTAEVQLQAQRTEAIINTALDGFFAVDLLGRIRAVNPAFCRMLGYAQEELLQMGVPDIEAIESPADVAARIEKIIAHGHDRFDTRHRRKDGVLVEVEMSVSYVNFGGVQMFYCFAHDITPRKHAEAALVEARNEAERANTAKSEFLSRMSHELRTPMNAILGYGQLLEQASLTPNQLENVGEIVYAGRHLLELINEILDLSRIEAGRVDLAIEAVELLPLINECMTMVRPLAAQRRINLATPANAGIRDAVRADHVRLRQILINLLSNAVKYNREAGSVFIDWRKNPDGSIRLSVRDTGKGIPPESMPLLFRPFERLESPYSGIEGTGIGLVLVKHLTEAMGGKIGVDSQVGVGSTFWIELPATEPTAG